MKTEIELAKQAGWEYADDDRGFEPLWRFAELVRADERERIKQENAPVIASINAHIQTLEEAAIRARGQA